jgi:ParB family transcriptional regulator, chromosome partitioning protein
VENIARRPPSPHALYREVRLLKGRGYTAEQIAAKLGMHVSYVYGLVNLLTRGETKLLQDVEARRIPITIAITIAEGKNADIQRALSEAYDKGEIRGSRLETAKRIISRHVADIQKSLKPTSKRASLSPAALIQEYERHTRRQKALVRRAALARRRLLVASSAMRHLLADDNFLTLLRAESLTTMPGHLAARVNEAQG